MIGHTYKSENKPPHLSQTPNPTEEMERSPPRMDNYRYKDEAGNWITSTELQSRAQLSKAWQGYLHSRAGKAEKQSRAAYLSSRTRP